MYSIANPTGAFKEKNYENNAAWTSVRLGGTPGRRTAEIISYSQCDEAKGLCGRNSPSMSRTENETDEMED